MKLPSTRLAHLGLRVTNLARARQLYVDILGFEPLLERPDVIYPVNPTGCATRCPHAFVKRVGSDTPMVNASA
jgi:catechol 2,3-dioxygenase-like lactoylglutathione lyase family enzyme